MKISILTIGDEILIGQIINTNASWISAQLTSIGIKVVAQSTVGDEKKQIIDEITRLFTLSDMIIATGGLGPTHDDITKKVLAEYFKKDLVIDKTALKNIEELAKLRNRKMTKLIESQALVLEGCMVLNNGVGSAPGMIIESKGKYLVSMPGVPSEMEYIVSNHLLDFIKNTRHKFSNEIVDYKTLKTVIIPESNLAELIGNTEEFLDGGSLAFLPSFEGVKLRIGVSGTSKADTQKKISRIENIIVERAGKYIYGTDDDSLTLKVHKLLIEKKLTVSVAESCTGGMLGMELSSLPGSSNYFQGGIISYSNEIKNNLLKVEKQILDIHGAVSTETVEQMVANVREICKTDFGISISGIAGPVGGSADKPVGTIYIGLSDKNGVISQRFLFSNNREINRKRSVYSALYMLYKKLLEL